MSLASGPGPGWLLFSFGMGLVSGSKCPNNCQCQAQEVICSGRKLTEYPPDIPLDTRRLYLNDNSIAFLPALNLGLLSDLVYLDCRNNLISEVMDYTFVGVYKLIYLDLSSNRLRSISPYSFSVLSNLLQLNISNNPHLLSLSKHTFANTSSLRYLDLRNTGLQTLDHTAFQSLLTLQTLYLSGNPWKCNCSFLDFTTYLIVSHLNHPGEGRLALGRGCEERPQRVPEKVTSRGGEDGRDPCTPGISGGKRSSCSEAQPRADSTQEGGRGTVLEERFPERVPIPNSVLPWGKPQVPDPQWGRQYCQIELSCRHKVVCVEMTKD